MGDWVYFLEAKDNGGWHINKIRTDGAMEATVVDEIVTSHRRIHSVFKDSTFIALGDWLYYVSMSTDQSTGEDMVVYHISRTKTDGSVTENLYSLEPQQRSSNAVYPNIEYIDDNDTLYYYTITGELQNYFAMDINGGEPKPLFSALLRGNNQNAVLFFFALDKDGNTYFTGYDFFNADEDDVTFKKDYAYPVYCLNGPLSSLSGGSVPIPLANGPGVDREMSEFHLAFVNNQLVTFSYDPSKPSDERYEFIRYDIATGAMAEITDDLPDLSNQPYPVVFADLHDGYIYFGYNMTNTMWWRIKPDGTGLEELNWMLTPESPKKPVVTP
jgi:hypothetical protein